MKLNEYDAALYDTIEKYLKFMALFSITNKQKSGPRI